GLVGLVFVLALGLHWAPNPQWSGASAALMLWAIVWTAAAEEIAFRGYALWRLKRLLGFWPAQAIVAALFVVSHLTLGGYAFLPALIGNVTGSFLYGVTFTRTRGLAAPIALHAGWNIAQHLLLSPGNATRPNLSTRPNRRGIRRNAGDRGTRDDGGGGRDLQSPSSSKITYIGRHRWGTWRLAWGEVNRRQRPSFSAGETFSDARASLPVPGASGWAGIVFNFYPSRDSSPWRAAPGSKRRYGTAGNSYVSVVDFGPVVKARSIRVFGQSGDPKSPHYQDQGELYARGGFQARLVHARRDQ